jgi:hypothetical protein
MSKSISPLTVFTTVFGRKSVSGSLNGGPMNHADIKEAKSEMKTRHGYIWLGLVGVLASLLFIAATCQQGSLKTLSPVQPPEALPEDVVLVSDNPKMFKVPAKTPILTMVKDDIEVSICYWRRADLDRKYNTGNAVSPFYEREALHQGEKADAFYVKITNNRPYKVLFRYNSRDLKIVDQGDNWYGVLTYEDLKERLELMTRVTGLHIKNGLEIARQILLEKAIGDPDRGVPSGESREGFLPFYQLKHNAESLTVNLPIEKVPPPNTAARYQTIMFEFPFTHSRGVRLAQPAPQRY